ncbi:hypothetical protein Tco_1383862 [Tanacetum coccineum]
MRELREDTFSRNKNEDAHDHVDRVLNITAKRLEDIHNFKRESDELFYQAWERYNDFLYKCPTHDINSHQKVNIFYKGLNTMNCQFLDSHGPIPGMTPTRALTAIQTMVDHSQKWHDGTSSKNVSNNNNTDGLVAIVSKLDNLERDMKKLKENVHAIEVDVKSAKDFTLTKNILLTRKSNSWKRSSMKNSGTPLLSMEVIEPSFILVLIIDHLLGEKRPRLEELMSKHREESAQRSAEMKKWFMKLQENAKINTRNQSASLKNLET